MLGEGESSSGDKEEVIASGQISSREGKREGTREGGRGGQLSEERGSLSVSVSQSDLPAAALFFLLSAWALSPAADQRSLTVFCLLTGFEHGLELNSYTQQDMRRVTGDSL